jgi:hypothetical protein
MQKPRQTQVRRTWRTPRATTPTPAARSGWRTAPDALAVARGRGRQATSRGRFGAMVPRGSAGRGPFAGRRKRSRGTSVMVLGRGLLGQQKRSVGQQKRSARSRKAPAALIAVLAGLGAAGAAAWKRRRGEEDPPTACVPPTAPASTTTSAPEASRPAGAP